MDVKEKAKQLNDQIVNWRRNLHQMPEVGMQCPNTARYICDRLEELGIPYTTYEKHSGITAIIGNGDGPVIALRADMDALNVMEENDLEYASKNGKMHACGHDAHTAMLLGAAKLLKEEEANLKGKVKLIFQPDEESVSGAKAMIADGVLENPKVDYMYALHCGNIIGNGNKPGDLLYKYGAVFASSDGFRVVFSGKGGHASTPDKAANPILAAAHFVESVQGLVGREVPSNIPTVLVVTQFKGGNDAVNIIPDTVEILGGLRTQSLEVRDKLHGLIKELAETTAKQYHGSAVYSLVNECPPTINNDQVTAQCLKSAEKIFGREHMVELKDASMGGEDAAYFFTKVPGCYLFLYNICPSDDGNVYPHHNSRFCIDDSVLYLGTALFVQSVIDNLE